MKGCKLLVLFFTLGGIAPGCRQLYIDDPLTWDRSGFPVGLVLCPNWQGWRGCAGLLLGLIPRAGTWISSTMISYFSLGVDGS
ncbi:hypothetical protein Nepgr_010485 [Nepenthes gracilis]|uniref:Uncharacterized protein n=1 Tax=Nepenthes gracilis TaxID=150966 RepID=A0AAD3SCI7_NEPGR|nr:hypothetical protein Nepgr_010485 [Nepenthes gracilis]